MKKISFRRAALGSASVFGMAMAFTGTAYAQNTQDAAAQPECTDPNDPNCQVGTSEQEIESGTNAGQEGPDLVVTGSRIRRPNVESQIPVTSLGGEEFFQQGSTNVGETLNDLPQLRSTFSQQNAGLGVGIVGLNLLDLRGLGSVRTLVLVNGRRHVASDIFTNSVTPDVNTIPNDLIERVDVVTGGNSAVYGSDAIAGVVNFILRRNFEGFQVRGNAGISEEGYGANQYASVLGGMNFADGRGNITAHAEYSYTERTYGSQLPFLRRVDGFVVVDADSGGLPNASDGFPDSVFLRDVRVGGASRFGTVTVPQRAGIAACGTGTSANNGPPNTAGTPYSCNFIFDANGNLVPQTGTRVGLGPLGTFIGGNGDTGREDNQVSIFPEQERINANILARYEFTDWLEAFVEAKAVRIRTVGLNAGPTFINNTTSGGNFDERIAPRLDNPFLSPQARTTIANAILASTCNFQPANLSQAATTCVGTGLTPAQIASINNGSYRFLFGRNLTDLPLRDEKFERNTFRVVGGVRGTFNDDWSYELSANYGIHREVNQQQGFVNTQRFLLSLDAGRNPVTGQIQCRSQFDPAARVGAPLYQNRTQTLNADIAACVPYNPFGRGDNRAAAEYFLYYPINRAQLTQLNILGFVSGDSSQLFELPGGPVRFVIGGEFRRDTAENDSDIAAESLISNSVFLGDFDQVQTEVKEAFAEIQIPLLRDVPFFQELTLSGAGRVSEYENQTVWAYNAGVEWTPIQDLRFRANYGRAVRAPNISESAFPVVPNFSNGFVDPCSVGAIGQNVNRNQNCTTQLTPAQLANLPPAGYSLPVLSGSNPALEAEKADTYTIGAVFTPRFVPGLSFTVDYYDITVNDVIATLGAQAIANSCYDSPGFTASTCALIQRNLGTTNGPNNELPGQILNNTLFQGPNNFAKLIRRGIDFELAYRTTITDDIRLNTRMIYTHQLQNSNFTNPTFPNLENRIVSEVGDPQDEFRFDLDLTFGAVTLGYQMRYIGPQYIGAYENVEPFPEGCTPALTPGAAPVCPPLNADQFDIFEYPAVVYHDLRADFRIGGGEGRSELNFFFGVDNLTDVEPPLGTIAGNANTSIFNVRGRNYYAGFRARF
jgi:outer membrane receptor protein involved in Fe transport